METCGKLNQGYGLWKEYSQEFEKQLHLLTSVGFTIVFIAHEGTREFQDENGEDYSKIYPAGDKRIIDPICNLVDIIGYAAVNGIDDETGQEIKSSLYLINTKKYHAGSRFDYLAGCIEEFTAENLQTAITEAIKAQEKADGVKATSYKKQAQAKKPVEKSFDELRDEIKELAEKLYKQDRMNEYKAIVEDRLGKGNGVQDAEPGQEQMLELILADLKMLD